MGPGCAPAYVAHRACWRANAPVLAGRNKAGHTGERRDRRGNVVCYASRDNP
jgi:hypothetical protein